MMYLIIMEDVELFRCTLKVTSAAATGGVWKVEGLLEVEGSLEVEVR